MIEQPGSADEPLARRGNGLMAETFVPLAEVDAELGALALEALGRARIAAYVEPTADPARQLLYADAFDRADARTIVARVWEAARERGTGSDPALSAPDLLRGRDTDAEFEALVADWHVDTVAAIRAAERDLKREDADWRARIAPAPVADDAEDHFVPPAPPPLPRLSAVAVIAMLVIALSIAILCSGAWLGLSMDLTFLTGIGGILLGAGMLVMRLRAQPDDEDDDGAVL